MAQPKMDPVVVRKVRMIILLAAGAMAIFGLLAVANVLKFGRLAGYIMIGVALLDAIIALVVFRDREA